MIALPVFERLTLTRWLKVSEAQVEGWLEQLSRVTRKYCLPPFFSEGGPAGWNWSRRVFRFTAWNRRVNCFSRVEIKRMALREKLAI